MIFIFNDISEIVAFKILNELSNIFGIAYCNVFFSMKAWVILWCDGGQLFLMLKEVHLVRDNCCFTML